MDLIALAAVSDNWVIGQGNELPWRSIPEDKQQYRDRTSDWPVILGRRTYESMLDDLPGNQQIVLTTQPEAVSSRPDVSLVTSIRDALSTLRDLEVDRAYVLGGGAIYEVFLPHLDRVLLSRVSGSYEGDTHFPRLERMDWECIDMETRTGFTLETWVPASSDTAVTD